MTDKTTQYLRPSELRKLLQNRRKTARKSVFMRLNEASLLTKIPEPKSNLRSYWPIGGNVRVTPRAADEAAKDWERSEANRISAGKGPIYIEVITYGTCLFIG